ncbi:MAG: rhomboid family intramembrane serine protease [Bacteroidota bacterium]
MNEDLFTRLRRWYNNKPPAIRTILGINVALYAAWLLLGGLLKIEAVAILYTDWLALTAAVPDALLKPWQVVSYNFIHLGLGFWGLIHILFNMAWMIWIGQDYEELYGTKNFWRLYLITGSVAGAVCVVIYGVFGMQPGTIVHGASASVFGIMACAATLNPNKSIALLFIGVVPLKWVVLGLLALDILFGLGGSTAVAAHFGGAITGFMFARVYHQGLFEGSSSSERRSSPKASSGGPSVLERLESLLEKNTSEKSSKPRRTRPRAVDTPTTTTVAGSQDQIDRILDKISEVGYEGLSDEEKRILYEASKD